MDALQPLPFAAETSAEPTAAELLQLLLADLQHIEARADLLRRRVEKDAFLSSTELPELAEEMLSTVEEWQEELSEVHEFVRANAEPEDEDNETGPRGDRDYAQPSDSAVPFLTGSGEPPPHDDDDAPPQPDTFRCTGCGDYFAAGSHGDCHGSQEVPHE